MTAGHAMPCDAMLCHAMPWSNNRRPLAARLLVPLSSRVLPRGASTWSRVAQPDHARPSLGSLAAVLGRSRTGLAAVLGHAGADTTTTSTSAQMPAQPAAVMVSHHCKLLVAGAWGLPTYGPQWPVVCSGQWPVSFRCPAHWDQVCFASVVVGRRRLIGLAVSADSTRIAASGSRFRHRRDGEIWKTGASSRALDTGPSVTLDLSGLPCFPRPFSRLNGSPPSSDAR